jgi:hypothetical protein
MNRPTKAALNTSEKLFDRVLCVAGAVGFSQAPEFMQQYLQRLGGHVAEARRQLEQFHNVAKQTGQTLDHLITTSKANADAAVAKLGGVMEAASTRVTELTAAETAIREASPVTRPFVFLQHVDSEIANATWTVFKPAVPTTVEGVLYAAVGIVLLLALYHGLIRQPIAHVYHKRQARKSALPEPVTRRA